MSSEEDNAPDAKEEPAVGEWKDPAQAVAFATLILIDGGVDISQDNLNKLLSAAKCEVDAALPVTYERASKKGMDLKDLIDNFGKGGPPAGGGGGAATGGADAGAVKEEEPEEESEKSSSKAGPGLFGGDDSDSDSDDSSS